MADVLPDDAPDSLVVMQAVAISQAPQTEMGQAYRRVYLENPVGFLREMNRLEAAYWSGKKNVDWDGKGVCPTCKRQGGHPDETDGLIGRILEG